MINCFKCNSLFLSVKKLAWGEQINALVQCTMDLMDYSGLVGLIELNLVDIR